MSKDLIAWIQARFKEKLQPIWKTVVAHSISGVVYFTDGMTAKYHGKRTLHPGESVLVAGDQIYSFEWSKAKIVPVGMLPVLVIAIVAESSGEANPRRYYLLSGTQLIEIGSPSGWELIDDGKYEINLTESHEDPDDYTYRYDGGGIGVPVGSSGNAAKLLQGNRARFILENAVEDELFWELEGSFLTGEDTVPIQSVMCADSLSMNLWAVQGKTGMRYTEEGVIGCVPNWIGMYSSQVMIYAAYGRNHVAAFDVDLLPIVHYLKYWKFDRTSSRIYVGNDGAMLGMSRYDPSRASDLLMLRPYTFQGDPPYGTILPAGETEVYYAEPVQKVLYDMAALTESVLTSWKRCTDTSATCMIHVHGLTYFANPIMLPVDCDWEGRMTYIKAWRNTDMSEYREQLFVRDVLTADTGLQTVIKQVLPDSAFNDMIRTSRLSVLQTYYDRYWNLCLYRLSERTGAPETLRPMPDLDEDYSVYQKDRYLAERRYPVKITWHVRVNGQTHTLPFECTGYERYPCWTDEEPEEGTTEISFIHAGCCTLTGVNLTRIFVNAGAQALILSVDVFDVAIQSTYQVYQCESGMRYVRPIYDDSVYAYPPASDAKPLRDRRWLIFSLDGSMTLADTPKEADGTHSPRVNGLVILDPRWQ